MRAGSSGFPGNPASGRADSSGFPGNPTSAREVVGLDACPAGWVGVALSGGRFGDAAVLRTAAEALARWPGAAVFGVDIPIGLPDSGVRRADHAARKFV